MLGTPKVYYIWYGNWSGTGSPNSNPTAQTILTDFITHFAPSSYFNINTAYVDGAGAPVTNAIQYGGSATDAYSHGTSLSDVDVKDIVARAIDSRSLPLDTNGVYFVLTSGDVGETSGFLTTYCGWHTRATINQAEVKYAFVGDAYANPTFCIAQPVPSLSPNGNASADGMANVIAHETEESVTDPDIDAWFSYDHRENADLCAWTFGSTLYQVSNGSYYNVTLGARPFLIQQNWVNASGGYCAMSY
jgi:hypothetical protein